MKRSSGILMPMSSLPSKYGIGTMGKSAYDFVDFLSAAGQKYWQILPLGPTGYGDSPYSSYSTFAGNPFLIDLEELVSDGLLDAEELDSIDWGSDPERVDYGKVYANRFKVLRIAYERAGEKAAEEVETFCRENAWAENYALFMALRKYFGGSEWTEWPDENIRMRRSDSVNYYKRLLKDEVDFYVFVQTLFFRQWDKLRAYAVEKGIDFIGDIPIYVLLDSADVWSEPQFFQLDEQYMPSMVAGVPPGAFTEEGQLWGNPLYAWDTMKKDGYGWWIRRIYGAKRLFDVIRIDHFRGLESYWAVPASETSAKKGHWVLGPGMDLVRIFVQWFHDVRFIAEDLGFPTPAVKQLLDESGFPGMKVLEFAFDPESDSDYLPHHGKQNSVCYIGTHDNETVLGWVENMSDEEREFAQSYMNISEDEGWCWGLIRTGMASVSDLFVVQMQDVLELDGSHRMNTPGVPTGNWQWRMLPDAASDDVAEKLLKYTKLFRRI